MANKWGPAEVNSGVEFPQSLSKMIIHHKAVHHMNQALSVPLANTFTR
jgi:hypothetical protein